MDQMPRSIASAFHEYKSETNPYKQLHRLVDTFEALIKYIAIIAIQNFYSARLDTAYLEVDQKIRGNLMRPSLGQWLEFIHDCLSSFGQNKDLLFCDDLYNLCFSTSGKSPKQQRQFGELSRKLIKLRNEEIGHGATLIDSEAEVRIYQYTSDLQQLLDNTSFLSGLYLWYIDSISESGFCKVQSLMGLPHEDEPIVSIYLPKLTETHHVVIHNPSTDACLDLHPLLIYTDCVADVMQWDMLHENLVGKHACGMRKLFFFNGLNGNEIVHKARITFLDYWRGHHSQFKPPNPVVADFIHRYPSARHLIGINNFDLLVQHHTDHFVGRKPELAELDKFVLQSTKHALVVFGSPGMGKSALLAKWSEQHQDVGARHFIREGDATTYKVEQVFSNLACQLSDRFGISWKRPNSSDPNLYRRAFDESLHKAAKSTTGNVIIIIDGLDEAIRAVSNAGSDPGQSIVEWLPDITSLPDNVYLVMSCRSELKTSQNFTAKYGEDKAVCLVLGRLSTDDIRALLFEVCNKYDVIDSPTYVSEIVDRSDGSPLYVRMLTEDLLEGRITFGNLNNLPHGVTAFFERILLRIENVGRSVDAISTEPQQHFLRYLLDQLVVECTITEEQASIILAKTPFLAREWNKRGSIALLVLFCIAKEPLSLAEAADMLGISHDDVQNAYSEISTVLISTEDGHFTLFHSAFRNYVLKRQVFVESGVQRHGALIQDVKTFLLNYCSQWEHHHSEYVRHHYASHLVDFDQLETLHNLVAGEDVTKWAAWHFNSDRHHGAFITDLARAWGNAESLPTTPQTLVQQVRYALIKSSIRSIAAALPAPMLPELVKFNLVSLEQAIEFSHNIGYPNQRSVALTGLIPFLKTRPNLLEDLLAKSRRGSDGILLTALIPLLNEHQINESNWKGILNREDWYLVNRRLDSLRKPTEGSTQEDTFEQSVRINLSILLKQDRQKQITLVRKLAKELPEQILSLCLTENGECIKDVSVLSEIIVAVAPYLSELSYERTLRAVACLVGTAFYQNTFISLVQHLPRETRDHALELIANNNAGYDLLCAVAPHLSSSDIEWVLEASHEVWEYSNWLDTWAEMAPYLTKDGLERAISLVNTLSDPRLISVLLIKLAPHLYPELLQKAWFIAYSLTTDIIIGVDTGERAEALSAISIYWPENERKSKIDEALDAAWSVTDLDGRTLAIKRLLPQLDQSIVIDILIRSAARQRKERLADPQHHSSKLGKTTTGSNKVDSVSVKSAESLDNVTDKGAIRFNDELVIECAIDNLHNLRSDQLRLQVVDEILFGLDNLPDLLYTPRGTLNRVTQVDRTPQREALVIKLLGDTTDVCLTSVIMYAIRHSATTPHIVAHISRLTPQERSQVLDRAIVDLPRLVDS